MSEQHIIPKELQSDMQAVMDALSSGKHMDAETHRRIRERADKVRDDLKRKHGEMNMAVDLIRQSRDEG